MTQSTNTAAAAPSQEVNAARKQRNKLILHVAIILVAALAIWFIPAPEGVDPRGMHMLAIFVGTILGLILQPLPTPSVALVGLGAAMITGTMAAKNEALTGFGNSSIWIIVAAFFIADGFLITGLGKRIALLFVRALGKSSLGLSYGMAITDLVLAPATPSNTARAGGVIYPIIRSLSEVNGSTNETPESRRKLGSYLLMTEAQVNTITSAMFLTAMAGNPLAQKFAHDRGINLDWGTWALAAIVPGLAALIVMPWIMSKIYPPTIKKTPDAPEHARQELHEMGPMSSKEWIMLGTFALLLILWVTGTALGIDATSAAFFGIAILLVTKVLTWKDMAKNSSAWSTLIFFAVLVGMADHLKKLKVVDWIGQQAAHSVSGMAHGVRDPDSGVLLHPLHVRFEHRAGCGAVRRVPRCGGSCRCSADVRGAVPRLHGQPDWRHHPLRFRPGGRVLRFRLLQRGRMVQDWLHGCYREPRRLGCSRYRVAVRARLRQLAAQTPRRLSSA